jgi:hypothetical protein
MEPVGKFLVVVNCLELIRRLEYPGVTFVRLGWVADEIWF